MAKRFLDTLTSEQRKQYPMSSGLVDYFADALALISHVSWTGNEKHNPGQPLHWSRWNSTDHADCVMRHHSTRDNEEHGIPFMHMAEEGWRVLAMIQEAMEEYYGLDLPRGARAKPEPLVCEKEEDIPGLTEAIGIPRMTMADYHVSADLLESVMNFVEPHDAPILRTPGEGEEDCLWVVQFCSKTTTLSRYPVIIHTSFKGPFPTIGLANQYARENPDNMPGVRSIHAINKP